MIRRYPLILLATIGLLIAPAAALAQDDSDQQAQQQVKDSAGAERVVFVEKDGKGLPAELQGWHRFFRRNLPEDVRDKRMRMLVRMTFDFNRSLQPKVAAACPVDEDDERHGTEIHLAPFSHTPIRRVGWKHGVQHGPDLQYGPEDKVEKEIPYVDGQIHGKRKVYFPTGELMAVTPYVKGQEQGESISYDREGRVTRRVTYVDGQKHGEMNDYWPETGKLKRTVPYDKGMINGKAIDYYSDGSIKRERPFQNNQFHGVEKQYDTEGNVVSTRYWLENKPVNRVKYEAAQAAADAGD